jgi:hypothetical protein
MYVALAAGPCVETPAAQVNEILSACGNLPFSGSDGMGSRRASLHLKNDGKVRYDYDANGKAAGLFRWLNLCFRSMPASPQLCIFILVANPPGVHATPGDGKGGVFEFDERGLVRDASTLADDDEDSATCVTLPMPDRVT